MSSILCSDHSAMKTSVYESVSLTLKLMGRVIPSSKQRVPVAPQNWARSNKNFKKKVLTAIRKHVFSFVKKMMKLELTWDKFWNQEVRKGSVPGQEQYRILGGGGPAHLPLLKLSQKKWPLSQVIAPPDKFLDPLLKSFKVGHYTWYTTGIETLHSSSVAVYN